MKTQKIKKKPGVFLNALANALANAPVTNLARGTNRASPHFVILLVERLLKNLIISLVYAIQYTEDHIIMLLTRVPGC